MTNLHRSLILGTSMLALAACGPEEIASPGTGGDIIINNPAPAPAPTPTSGGGSGGSFTAATSCPSIAATGGLSQGASINVPGGTVLVCELPQVIDASSSLPATPNSAKVIYEIPGRVDVGSDGGPSPSDSDGASDTDVTLTIEGGAVLYGGTGNSLLVVNRGNKLNAQGSASAPIVFTSEQNINGSTNDDSDQQWGGVVLLGRAPISDCLDGGATGGTVDCENQIEGTPVSALYGGATSNDDSGTIRYVQIRFSGFPLDGDNELQSLTTGGTGSGTTIEYFQSFNSFDDGIEFFGGVVNGKYLVINGAGDDSLDTDFGAQINLQWVIAVQRSAIGNGIIEGDSGGGGDDLPRQDTRIANATFVARSTDSDAAAFRFRGGSDFALANVVLDASAYNRQCLDLDDAETVQANGRQENGAPFFAAVHMDCPSASAIYTDDDPPADEADAQAAFLAGSNNEFDDGGLEKSEDYTNSLTMVFVNGSTENGFAAFDPSVFDRSSFSFDSPGFVGADDGNQSWYKGWTCNAGYAPMSGNSDCAASPVS